MNRKHTIDEWFPFGLKEVGVKIYGDQEKKEQKDLFESIKVNGGTKIIINIKNKTQTFKFSLNENRKIDRNLIKSLKIEENIVSI